MVTLLNSMKRKLLLLFFCLAFTNNLFCQWQTIYKDSLNYSFTCAHFLNNDTGFVAGFHYPLPSGVIFRTFDGGQTWDSLLIPVYVSNIQFINDSTGFAGGSDGFVYRTTDLGTNWNLMGSNTWDDLTGMFFLNKDTGYQITGNIIDKTTDGGITWQVIFNSTGYGETIGGKMMFPDSITGYAVQGFYSGGAISKTSDAGSTWSDLLIPLDFYPHSCFFWNQNIGWAVGHNGKISKTNDGGLTMVNT